MKKRANITIIIMAIFVCLMLIQCGCGKTHQVSKVNTSGFLGDYSQLEEGSKGEAQLLYISRSANFKAYDKILLEPIRVFAEQGGKLSKMPREDVQNIINYLDSSIREQLKGDYYFVSRPGLGVMHLRIAITEAEGSNVPLDTVSTVLPIGIAISAIKQIATGTHAFTGKMGIEAELLDSQTNTRLAAAVDRRAGEKITGKFDKFNKWRAAQGACDYWAVRLRHRLTELREGAGK